jgi:hypothetical protein
MQLVHQLPLKDPAIAKEGGRMVESICGWTLIALPSMATM